MARRGKRSGLAALLTAPIRRFWRRMKPRGAGAPAVGGVRFGDFARQAPFSRWGFGRGQPIDRWYIEAFLGRLAGDIRGRVLEIGDSSYTVRFGEARVERSDVLHVVAGTEGATITGDLSAEGTLPVEAFDCIICTQTLQQIAHPAAAVQNLRRALLPGGSLLVTVPGITQVDRKAMDRWGDYWRFTVKGMRELLSKEFSDAEMEISAFGNVHTAAAFLYGLAVEELDPSAFEYDDPDYEVLVAARVRKAQPSATQPKA